MSRNMHVFLLLFSCLAFVSCAGISVLGRQMFSRQRADYDIRLERETERLLNYFGQCFESNLLSCNTIFSSKWYKHYRNVSSIYADEFDGPKRIEISESLQSMITGMQFVSDILVITPSLDSVICRSGWYTLNNYQAIYSTVQIDTTAGNTCAPILSVINDGMCAVTLNDPTLRRDKTVLCMLIDKKAFASRLQSVCPEYVVYIKAILDGQTLTTWGEESDTKMLSALHSSSSLSLTVGYRSFEQVEQPSLIVLLAALLFALLLACALISLLAMRVITRPVARMVLSAGGQKHDLANPFRFLQDYLNTLSLRQDQLSAEKESLVQSKNRFLTMMNDEIYYGMLTNPNFNFKDEYVVSVIPELQEDKICLLALLHPKYQYRAPQPPFPSSAGFTQLATRMHTVQINQDQCLFLWTQAQQADACEAAAMEKLARMHLYDTALTRVRKPEGFHTAYLELRRSLDRQHSARLDLPVSVENRVVNLLRANHCEKCRQLLKTLHGAYAPDALMRLFWRIGTELDHPMDSVLERYDGATDTMDEPAQWDVLDSCVADLCACASAAQRKSSTGPSAENICWFIQEHYTDPQLCIAQLAERFSIHRTLVSKLIKMHTGQTFSDWLQSLRIQAAIRLLTETDLSATAIAQQVGYANYVTFKRAFIRQCGCSPREYISVTESPVL